MKCGKSSRVISVMQPLQQSHTHTHTSHFWNVPELESFKWSGEWIIREKSGLWIPWGRVTANSTLDVLKFPSLPLAIDCNSCNGCHLQGKRGRSTAFVITSGERSVTGTVWTWSSISRIEATWTNMNQHINHYIYLLHDIVYKTVWS